MSNDDLDTLRPEVREAVDAFDIGARVGMTFGNKTWNTIRAELLRLADENARLSGRLCLVCGLHNDSQCPQRNDEMSPCTFDPSPVEAAKAFFARATKAEAELAALQARIDALMLEFCPEDMTEEQVAAWSARQRVVDEPQDDNAKEGRSRE